MIRSDTFILLAWTSAVCALLCVCTAAYGQDEPLEDQYYLGTERELMIRVHIWGEVRDTGEYLVADGSTVLDLISKAGGPTEYASLKNVRITHVKAHSPRTAEVDLTSYLDKDISPALPVLLPGDVVRVAPNRWQRWTRLTRVASNIVTIASAVYWYWQISDLKW